MKSDEQAPSFKIAGRALTICLAAFLLALYYHSSQGGERKELVLVFVSGLLVGSAVAAVLIMWFLTMDCDDHED